MLYLTVIVFVLVFLIELICYIPINIYFYLSDDSIYLYVFTLPILVITNNKYINFLKNKISIEQILKASKIDLKIIEAIKINKIHLQIKDELANQYPNYIYPLVALNNFNIVTFKIKKENSFYLKAQINIVNIIQEIIVIRRLKRHERKSNK